MAMAFALIIVALSGVAATWFNESWTPQPQKVTDSRTRGARATEFDWAAIAQNTTK